MQVGFNAWASENGLGNFAHVVELFSLSLSLLPDCFISSLDDLSSQVKSRRRKISGRCRRRGHFRFPLLLYQSLLLQLVVSGVITRSQHHLAQRGLVRVQQSVKKHKNNNSGVMMNPLMRTGSAELAQWERRARCTDKARSPPSITGVCKRRIRFLLIAYPCIPASPPWPEKFTTDWKSHSTNYE